MVAKKIAVVSFFGNETINFSVSNVATTVIRDDTAVVYAWCRRADDAVDLATSDAERALCADAHQARINGDRAKWHQVPFFNSNAPTSRVRLYAETWRRTTFARSGGGDVAPIVESR